MNGGCAFFNTTTTAVWTSLSSSGAPCRVSLSRAAAIERRDQLWDEEILFPCQEEISAAKHIARVLPENVMQQVTVIATMLFDV
jgi:hypothetical protein